MAGGCGRCPALVRIRAALQRSFGTCIAHLRLLDRAGMPPTVDPPSRGLRMANVAAYGGHGLSRPAETQTRRSSARPQTLGCALYTFQLLGAPFRHTGASNGRRPRRYASAPPTRRDSTLACSAFTPLDALHSPSDHQPDQARQPQGPAGSPDAIRLRQRRRSATARPL